jgi:hypothetical protein
MISKPKLSSLVSKQLPEFIREDYPTFVTFLEAYYEWLGTQDADLYKLRDIDNTLDTFLEHFRSELAFNLPVVEVDEKFLLTHVKDKYLAKGSEASFKLLFRLLFNKDIAVDYPGKKLLRASDGRWNQDVSIFIKVNAGDPNSIVGKLVEVVTPAKIIRVLIDRRQDVEVEIDRFVQISPDTYEFYIDRRFFGEINIGDRIRYEGIFDGTIVSTTSNLEILQRGRNFKIGELYQIRNGNGTGSTLKVKTVNSEGGILAAEFIKYGIGYETDFTATLLSKAGQTTTGIGTTAINITTVSDAVTSIQITDGGSGYSATPTVALSGGGFTSAATVGAVTVVGGVITEIKVATNGSGYSAVPDVIIVDDTGVGAEAIATVGQLSNYEIFETTAGFREQGFVNKADYTQDIPTIWEPSKAFALNTLLYFQNRLYQVTAAGTTSNIPPTHQITTIVNAGSFTIGDEYVITSIGTTDFTLIGSTSNAIGTKFTATGIGTGTGTAGEPVSAANGTVQLEYVRLHGPAWDGTYSGETVREFYYESTDAIINPLDPAIIKITLGSLTKYPGYYSTNDGFLDDDIYIQDSRYYQVYSYLIKIDERLESYKSAVKTLVHPSGLALFGEYDIRNEFHLDLNLQSLVQILVLAFQDEVFVRDDTLIEFIIGKLIEISFTTTEQTTFALNKPLANDFELSDEAVFRDFGKDLTSATEGFSETTVYDFGKSLSSSQTVVESEIRFVSKALENDFEPTDEAVLDTDKYISISTSAVDGGGEIWLSPYNNPYPESDAYFAHDDGNYTTGESAFTG